MRTRCELCWESTIPEVWDYETERTVIGADPGVRATARNGRRICDKCAKHISESWQRVLEAGR